MVGHPAWPAWPSILPCTVDVMIPRLLPHPIPRLRHPIKSRLNRWLIAVPASEKRLPKRERTCREAKLSNLVATPFREATNQLMASRDGEARH